MSEDSPTGERVDSPSRREILRVIGAGGLVGTVGGGRAAGTPGRGGPPEGRGPPEKCECPDDSFLAKYDFDGCEFVLVEGEDVIDITGWESKDGESCEPVSLSYDPVGVAVESVCAFGGRDTDTDEEPDGTYVSDLENPGGGRAAISNITFCGSTDPECFQIDLVGGEVIEEFSDDPDSEAYEYGERLITAMNGCSDDEEPTVKSNGTNTVPVDGESCTFSFDDLSFDPDGPTATVSLTFDGGSDQPEECRGTLAGYLLPGGPDSGSDLDRQELRGYETRTIAAGETVDLEVRLDG